MANGDGAVVYTTKELLARIEAKVDAIDTKLDSKADRLRVHELSGDFAAIRLLLAGYPTHLAELQELKKQVDGLRYWKAGVVGAFLLLSALATTNGVHIWFS